QSWSKPITNESLNTSLKYSYQINDKWNGNLSVSQSRVVVDDYSAFAYTFDTDGNYDIYDFRSPDDSYLTNQFKTGLNGKFNT
ncbi:TonB-dependent siderophore receptor, partial [bacterium LRH843]|nr:TonB-dependent siderophore receptor [bacterium LRH843]